MDELKRIGELTLERMDRESRAISHKKSYSEQQKEFKKKTAKLRKLIKGFGSAVKDKQSEIDEEVMKVMKSFNHSKTISAYAKKIQE
jgi:hypothetical protein